MEEGVGEGAKEGWDRQGRQGPEGVRWKDQENSVPSAQDERHDNLCRWPDVVDTVIGHSIPLIVHNNVSIFYDDESADISCKII